MPIGDRDNIELTWGNDRTRRTYGEVEGTYADTSETYGGSDERPQRQDPADYLSVPDTNDWSFGQGTWTFSWWVKPRMVPDEPTLEEEFFSRDPEG